jgi:hypothetical protein
MLLIELPADCVMNQAAQGCKHADRKSRVGALQLKPALTNRALCCRNTFSDPGNQVRLDPYTGPWIAVQPLLCLIDPVRIVEAIAFLNKAV